jgi:inorganic pyrophosphatase
MRIDAIPIGNNPPEDVNVIIEVEIGYPGNYGFVPHTLSEDGDPIDVLVANTRPIVPGAVINVRPVGVLRMEDNAGGDEKIIAVPSPKLTKRYLGVHNYTDLPDISIAQIQHFFEHYKDLEEGKWVKLGGWGDADEARRMIVEAIEREKKRKAAL